MKKRPTRRPASTRRTKKPAPAIVATSPSLTQLARYVRLRLVTLQQLYTLRANTSTNEPEEMVNRHTATMLDECLAVLTDARLLDARPKGGAQ